MNNLILLPGGGFFADITQQVTETELSKINLP